MGCRWCCGMDEAADTLRATSRGICFATNYRYVFYCKLPYDVRRLARAIDRLWYVKRATNLFHVQRLFIFDASHESCNAICDIIQQLVRVQVRRRASGDFAMYS